jgi:hypothetical protein
MTSAARERRLPGVLLALAFALLLLGPGAAARPAEPGTAPAASVAAASPAGAERATVRQRPEGRALLDANRDRHGPAAPGLPATASAVTVLTWIVLRCPPAGRQGRRIRPSAGPRAPPSLQPA